MTMPDIEARHFRDVLGHFPTGVVVVTAIGPDGEPAGMAIGSFTSVSLDPPLVAFLPAKTSTSWPRMSGAESFCVNVLGHPQAELGRAFARSGGPKFDGLAWTPAPSGAPVLPGVLAWIDCRRSDVHSAGDHWIVLGEVTALSADPEAEGPLVFYRGAFGHFAVPPPAGPATI
ncbi:flavin reductase [Nakamurella sp. YIM 132087]|uniref:Flavin reductase n=1 Tax=Nakamurella alba TaxID=2665158 RepID=A0A7K1FV69_9ACTN|nr:flavin reductase family protein [Nakamurella alba]MTD17093.1 flavin reductase [Nakamurella alba]